MTYSDSPSPPGDEPSCGDLPGHDIGRILALLNQTNTVEKGFDQTTMKIVERSFLKHVATDPTPDFGSTASSTLFIKNMTDCHAAAQLIRLKDLEPCLSMYRDYVSNREVRFS